MMKLFSSLMGGNAASTPARPDAELGEQPLEHYIALAIRESGVLTPRGEAAIADYLQQFGRAPGQQLDDARCRGKQAADMQLNIRAAELLRVPLSPRRSLSIFADELHRGAILQKARQDAVARMRGFCEQMTLTVAGTGEECEWCRANDGKRFAIGLDPNHLLALHCSCAPYSSTTFHPAINTFDQSSTGTAGVSSNSW